MPRTASAFCFLIINPDHILTDLEILRIAGSNLNINMYILNLVLARKYLFIIIYHLTGSLILDVGTNYLLLYIHLTERLRVKEDFHL